MNQHGSQGKGRRRETRPAAKPLDYDHRVLDIARVTRVVKGGRRFRFRAVVVVGDRKGKVGVGVDKGQDVSLAIAKATHQARQAMIRVPLRDGSLPYEVESKYASARVLLRPAPKGKGLIAGGAVRAVCDLAGIANLTSKVLSRSGNKLNVARATLKAIQSIRHVPESADAPTPTTLPEQEPVIT